LTAVGALLEFHEGVERARELTLKGGFIPEEEMKPNGSIAEGLEGGRGPDGDGAGFGVLTGDGCVEGSALEVADTKLTPTGHGQSFRPGSFRRESADEIRQC